MRLADLSRMALIASALLLGALLLVGACGGGDDDDDSNGEATATPAETEPSDGDDDGGNGGEVSFDVSMGDNFFDPTEFTVDAGATVTFNLSNDGIAIHNMRIGGEDNEYNTDDDSVSDPELMTGGQTATLVWTAPSTAGEYIFQCDFHPTDMLGTITVE